MIKNHDMIEQALSARLRDDAGLAALLSDLGPDDSTFLLDFLAEFATDLARIEIN